RLQLAEHRHRLLHRHLGRGRGNAARTGGLRVRNGSRGLGRRQHPLGSDRGDPRGRGRRPAVVALRDPALRPDSAMRARFVALAFLTLIAGWLRFSSTDFGLPDKYRPDEEYLVSRALGFRQDWNPHFAVYPAFHMYVQHAVLRATAWVAGHEGDFRAYY